MVSDGERRPRTGTRRTDVLLVDDDAMVRAWLRLQLDGPEIFLVAEAYSAESALAELETSAPQILIIDQRLPDGPGSDFVRVLRQRGDRRRILMITAGRQEGFNELARHSGANGTLVKNSDPEQLMAALRSLRAGRTWFDPRHPTGGPTLSPREREAIRLVADGKTNREIAVELGIGEQTVKTMLTRAFVKLGVRRRAEAISEATRLGLL
jgi:DNA-binding NarL/FixJ family response regulator